MKTNPSNTALRRQRERLAHRDAILLAAERVFAAQGYDVATVEQIAREAEYATGTLYNFFENKAALFLAVADRILDELLRRFDADVAPWSDRPLEALPRFFALRLDEIHEHEAFLNVFLPVRKTVRSGRGGDPDAPDPRFLRYRSKALALFEEGVRQGLLHDLSPADLLAVVEGTIRFYVKLWRCPHFESPPAGQRSAKLAGVLLSLLLAHPESHPTP